MRRITSSSSPSLSPASPATIAPPVSQCSATSAKSRGGRDEVPAKITSSIPPPRIDLGEDSPITQRIASSRFDLPQPLGPTPPVSPGSMRRDRKSVVSGKSVSVRVDLGGRRIMKKKKKKDI